MDEYFQESPPDSRPEGKPITTEQEALIFLAEEQNATGELYRYLTRHPDDVEVGEISDMSPEEFDAYLETREIIDDIRAALPRMPKN